MYNVQTGQFIVEIPKNGSRSMVKAVLTAYGKNCAKAQGHFTVAEFLNDKLTLVAKPRRPRMPMQTICVVRNPAQRLFSQVLHAVRHKHGMDVDRAMNVAWEQSDIVFKPQWQFLELPETGEYELDLRLWDMARIDQALVFASGTPMNLHLNMAPTRPNETIDQIIAHKLYDELMDSEDHYAKDYKLWLRALKTSTLGLEP